MKISNRIVILAGIAIMPGVGFAQTASPSPNPFGLTGDWGGTRTKLASQGYSFRSYLTQFFVDPLTGGINTGSKSTGKFDLFFDIDGTKSGLGKGVGFHTHLEGRWGDSVIGTAVTANPILTTNQYPKLGGTEFAFTSAYFSLPLAAKTSMVIGKLNMYDLGEKTQFRGGRGVDRFQNASFTGPVVNSRVMPPINFGAMATHIHMLSPKQPGAFTFGLFGSTAVTSDFDLGKAFDKGVSLLGSFTIPGVAKGQGTSAFTIIYSTKDRASINDIPNIFLPPLPAANKTNRSWVISYDYSQPLAAKWGWFGSLATSDGDPGPYKFSGTLGIGGDGIIESRPNDRFGVGLYYTDPSDALRDAFKGVVKFDAEYGVETFYNYAVNDWFRIGANVQAVNPLLRGSDDLFVYSLNAQIRF